MPKEDKTQPLNKVWRQRRPRAASKANEKPVGPSETLVEDSVVPVDSEKNESKKVVDLTANTSAKIWQQEEKPRASGHRVSG